MRILAMFTPMSLGERVVVDVVIVCLFGVLARPSHGMNQRGMASALLMSVGGLVAFEPVFPSFSYYESLMPAVLIAILSGIVFLRPARRSSVKPRRLARLGLCAITF